MDQKIIFDIDFKFLNNWKIVETLNFNKTKHHLENSSNNIIYYCFPDFPIHIPPDVQLNRIFNQKVSFFYAVSCFSLK